MKLFRKNEIIKAQAKLKRMKISTIFQILTKNCWEFNIQYEIVLKTENSLIIRLDGNREAILFAYYSMDMVFVEDYNYFIELLDIEAVKKGVFISSGVIEAQVYKLNNLYFFHKRVKIQDGRHFIKKQLGFKGKCSELFRKKRFGFCKYLPN